MIFSVKPFEIHDGDGIRTTVFFKGCPLRCRWCHNPEALTAAPQLSVDTEKCVKCGACAAVCDVHTVKDGVHTFDRERCIACGKCVPHCPVSALRLYGEDPTIDELMKQLLEDRVFYEASGGGVTVSGGEPLMQADRVAELLKRLKAEGINTAIDTCGFASRSAVDKVLPYTDTFLYDVKTMDDAVHTAYTGQSNAPILDNLRYIDAQNKRIEIRIPFIPGVNDTNIASIGEFLATLHNVVRVRVLAYHNHAAKKYTCLGYTYECADTPVPSDTDIDNAIATLRSFGLNAMRSGDND